MKRIQFKWIAAAALALALGPQGAAQAEPEIDTNALYQFAVGLAAVQSEVDSIMEQAEEGGFEERDENDAAARQLCLSASSSLASASQSALQAAQDSSVGKIQSAYDNFVDACIESSWAAADLASAAFAALQPPPGSYTPFSPKITTTMNKVVNLRASVQCP